MFKTKAALIAILTLTVASPVAAELAANSVTASKILAGAVTADKLSVTSLSSISSDLGTALAGSLVVGGSNKIWLNDAGDGSLHIGGSSKPDARFQISASGALAAQDPLFVGLLQINSGNAVSLYLNDGAIKIDALAGGGTRAICVDNDGVLFAAASC